MAQTLRDLLIQRAARLQERPAFTAPDWGTLSYAQLRNRAEGVAFGMLALPLPPGAVSAASGRPWDWMAELACAAVGWAWEETGPPLPAEILGGPGFHAEAGRGLYHARESAVLPGTVFHAGLTQGEVLRRLARLNEALGWDHDTEIPMPGQAAATAPGRAALWSALYAGGHVRLVDPSVPGRGLLDRWRRSSPPAWDPSPFEGFWASHWTVPGQ